MWIPKVDPRPEESSQCEKTAKLLARKCCSARRVHSSINVIRVLRHISKEHHQIADCCWLLPYLDLLEYCDVTLRVWCWCVCCDKHQTSDPQRTSCSLGQRAVFLALCVHSWIFGVKQKIMLTLVVQQLLNEYPSLVLLWIVDFRIFLMAFLFFGAMKTCNYEDLLYICFLICLFKIYKRYCSSRQISLITIKSDIIKLLDFFYFILLIS